MLRTGLTGAGRTSLVLVDKSLQLFLLCQNRNVGAFSPDLFFLDLFQISGDLAVIHRQFTAIDIECLIAGGREEFTIVRHDEAGGGKVLQKMFEQNLGAQVEKVRRLVQHQQIWIM